MSKAARKLVFSLEFPGTDVRYGSLYEDTKEMVDNSTATIDVAVSALVRALSASTAILNELHEIGDGAEWDLAGRVRLNRKALEEWKDES